VPTFFLFFPQAKEDSPPPPPPHSQPPHSKKTAHSHPPPPPPMIRKRKDKPFFLFSPPFLPSLPFSLMEGRGVPFSFSPPPSGGGDFSLFHFLFLSSGRVVLLFSFPFSVKALFSRVVFGCTPKPGAFLPPLRSETLSRRRLPGVWPASQLMRSSLPDELARDLMFQKTFPLPPSVVFPF